MFKKMMNLGGCGRRVGYCGLLALAAFVSIGSAHALAEPVDRPAYGLIVKLKDNAPALTGQVQRLSATQGATADDALSRSMRLQGVLRAAAVQPSTQRPVGGSAQLLGFGRVMSAAEAERTADQLRSRPEVEWVVPNHRERRLQVTVPNDTLFAEQWWLHPVSGSNGNVLKDRLRGVPGFQSAWAVNTGSAQAVVAVLDTGITRHPDLDEHVVLPGHDFVANVIAANDGDGRDADASDPGDGVSAADKAAHPTEFANCAVEGSSWHGTEVAALIAGVSNNGLGVAAINWNARVLPVRVAGKCGAEVADILDGMRWAAGLKVEGAPLNPNPARVINISFGSNAPCNPAYQTVVDELAATGLGVVVVAAVGNAHGAVDRPANCKGVVAVAGLNRDGFKNTYSNFGPQVVVSTVSGDPESRGAWGALLADNGLLTLGNDGTTTPGNPGYYRVFGTSFAAPMVAGAISLMLSVDPTLSGAQIINGLRVSARPHVTAPKTGMGVCSWQNPGRCVCDTASCGAGILDAQQAVRYAANPAGYVPPAQLAAVIDNADVDAAVSRGPDRAANPEPEPVLSPVAGSQGGGGAIDPTWLLGLTAASLALWACRRRGSGRRAHSVLRRFAGATVTPP